jgi:hypothetical protein
VRGMTSEENSQQLASERLKGSYVGLARKAAVRMIS